LVAGLTLRRSPDPRPLAEVAAALVLATVLAVAWPYYDVTRLLSSGDAYDLANKATYLRVPQRTFLAAVGLIPLVQRARRELLDPLVLAAVSAGSVVLLGGLSQRWIGGRAMPFLLFALHLACAGWLVEAWRRASSSARRVGLVAALGLVCVVGAAGATDGLIALTPRALLPTSTREGSKAQSEVAASRWLDAGRDGDVVVGTDLRCLRAATGRGLRAVAPSFATPFVPDVDDRWRDSEAYLDGDARLRAEIAERWDIGYVLVGPDQAVELDPSTLVAQSDGCRLFAAGSETAGA
jgi:hypothetical protein